MRISMTIIEQSMDLPGLGAAQLSQAVWLAIVSMGGRCVEIGAVFFISGFRLDCQRRG
jgi:hypothetical protein